MYTIELPLGSSRSVYIIIHIIQSLLYTEVIHVIQCYSCYSVKEKAPYVHQVPLVAYMKAYLKFFKLYILPFPCQIQGRNRNKEQYYFIAPCTCSVINFSPENQLERLS